MQRGENRRTSNTRDINICVQDPSGNRFECEIPTDMKLGEVAAEFYADQGWQPKDKQGRGQRAVVELVDPENPDRTKRLRGDQTAEDTGLWDGAILRIIPESIAGAMDENTRIPRLVADHNAMKDLAGWNSHINFETNKDHTPTRYTVTFDYRSFKALSEDGQTPEFISQHRIEITLGAEYPSKAPFVRWLTPIFHPNIDAKTGQVCLGALMERYLPGMGLARLVTMLAEMTQYLNFDMTNALNGEAAKWAGDPQNWKHITVIGGSPFQGPVEELLKELKEKQGMARSSARITFNPVNSRTMS